MTPVNSPSLIEPMNIANESGRSRRQRARYLPHPAREQIELPAVLDALSDSTRLAIVVDLAARKGEWEARCGAFCHLGGKTNLTYHFARLRAAGVTHARVEGTSRFISLRREDLDARFPGLLDSVVAAARETVRKSRSPARKRRNAAG
jgi:DNA-binding transcriptional ArsR family regulator